MTFLLGLLIGLIPFIAIVVAALRRRSAHPQNSIQHVQERVHAVKRSTNGTTHAY